MATHDVTTNWTGTEIRASMMDGESTKVFAGISVQRTDTGGPVIVAFESNSDIEILGSVSGVATNFSAILMGNALTESNNSLTVGADGSVTGRTQLMSHSSSITNAGTMDSILFWSMDNGSHSTIENSGTIEDDTAVQRSDSSDEELRLTNSGTIRGDLAFFSFSDVNAVDIITNTGLFDGDVMLGGGNDTYDGDGGVTDGIVDGESGDDTLIGGAEIDRFKGGKGNDAIDGGGQNDVIHGGIGGDTLTGGTGRDHFIFLTAKESGSKKGTYDTITDYSKKDDIKLFAIDADGSKAGNGEFDFIGKDSFSGENGELRYQVKGGNTFVYGDTNGDGKADFAIKFDDVLKLKADDFAL
jgi:Ca2+-binding RTX toxin-like protein